MIKFKFLLLFTILISYYFSSCRAFKSNNYISNKTIYKWENKIVSKKKHDKLLHNYTIEFVKNSNPKDLELFYNLTVVYDTIPKNKTE